MIFFFFLFLDFYTRITLFKNGNINCIKSKKSG